MDVESKLDALAEFRDSYFELNPSSSEADRSKAVKERAQQLIEEIPINECQLRSVPYNLLCGRIMSTCIDYEERAEQYLSKSLKLDPSQANGWAELGSVLAKKPDYPYAKDCFMESLQLEKSCKALCELAWILREETRDPKLGDVEKSMAWKQSLAYTKEAVALFPSCGMAHTCNGNAMFRQFFMTKQYQPHLLELVVKSYRLALEDKKECKNPDLHMNLAVATRYLEDYPLALRHSREAVRLEPSALARAKLNSLTSYLLKVHAAVDRKGKLKAKRLQELTAFLKKHDGGIFTKRPFTVDGQPLTLRPVKFSALTEGANPGSLLVASIVATVPHDDDVPLATAAVDADETAFCVSVYNCSSSFGFVIGDTITIAEPYLILCQDLPVSADGPPVSFPVIYVHNPASLTRNGAITKSSHLAPTLVK